MTMRSVVIRNPATIAAAAASTYRPATEPGAKSIGRVANTTNATAKEFQDIVGYQVKGQLLMQKNPVIQAARSLDSDPIWKQGFDAAVGICTGMTGIGAGQVRWRAVLTYTPGLVGPVQRDKITAGWDVGQALVHGIAKAEQEALNVPTDPFGAAGFTTTTGIAGSSLSSDGRAGVMTTLANNDAARAGAVKAIDEHKGLWRRFLGLFGL